MVMMRAGSELVGSYRITSPARQERMPYFRLPKYRPSKSGMPVQSEASTGICQSRSVFLSSNKALI